MVAALVVVETVVVVAEMAVVAAVVDSVELSSALNPGNSWYSARQRQPDTLVRMRANSDG